MALDLKQRLQDREAAFGQNSSITDTISNIELATQLTNILVTDIEPFTTPDGKLQPYRIQETKIEALVASIEDIGIVTPLLVRRKGTKYEVISGHHRYYAAQRLSLDTVPAKICEVDDDLAYKIVCESNTPTGELLPSERCTIYNAYLDKRKDGEEKYTVQELVNKFSLGSPKTVYRYAALKAIVPNLLDCVDCKIINVMNCDKIIASLSLEEQQAVADYIKDYEVHRLGNKEINAIIEYTEHTDELITPDNIDAILNIDESESSQDDEETDEDKDYAKTKVFKNIRHLFSGHSVAALSQEDTEALIIKLLSMYIEENEEE